MKKRIIKESRSRYVTEQKNGLCIQVNVVIYHEGIKYNNNINVQSRPRTDYDSCFGIWQKERKKTIETGDKLLKRSCRKLSIQCLLN